MREPTVAASFATALIEFAVARGAHRQTLIRRAGVATDALDEPEARVPLTRYVALLHAGAELTRQPAFALHFGEKVPTQDLSFLGQLVSNAGSVEEARRQTNRYSPLLLDDGNDPAIERAELAQRDGKLWMLFPSPVYARYPLLTESALARGVCGTRGMIASLGMPLRFPDAIHFTFPEPAYRAEYDRVFGVPLVFGSDVTAIVTDASILTRKWPRSGGPALAVLKARAEEQLARLQRTPSLRGSVESLLLKGLSGGDVRIETIAAKLAVSRATLFRRLKAEGVTFQQILDGVRRERALHYLGMRKTVQQAASLVGFSDPAAFSRAFKRWTGMSPRRHLATKGQVSETEDHNPLPRRA